MDEYSEALKRGRKEYVEREYVRSMLRTHFEGIRSALALQLSEETVFVVDFLDDSSPSIQLRGRRPVQNSTQLALVTFVGAVMSPRGWDVEVYSGPIRQGDKCHFANSKAALQTILMNICASDRIADILTNFELKEGVIADD